MLLWRRLPGSVWLMGILVVLATCVTADAVSRGASASAPEPMFVDFTSSNPIGPGMTLTLTANLPATLRFDDGDGVIQTVDLLGATLNVTTSSDSLVNNYYKAVTITQLTGNVGSFVVGGVHFDGAQFSSVEPGKASINYSRGVLMASIRLRACATGLPATIATAYTSGQMLSPTTMRLFMDGDSVVEPHSVPTLSRMSAVAMTVLLAMAACGIILRRRTVGG